MNSAGSALETAATSEAGEDDSPATVANRPINVAVVGCGYWGPNLIRNFEAIPECFMKTICDVDQQRLAHMHDIFPHVGTTGRIANIIEDDEIDAVAIATPLRYHYGLASEALSAGKHVFIEKPMAGLTTECEDLIRLARKNNRILMVGHTFLYSSSVRRIKEIVDQGELGRILYVSARRLNLGLFQRDINVAWDLAPHDLAIILHVLGASPVSVSCQGRAHFAEGIEDVTSMALNFQDNVFAVIQSSWLDPNKVREITFVGPRKMLVYNDIEMNEKIKIYDKHVQAPPHYDTFAEFQYSYHYGDILSPYVKQVEPLRIECQHFLECIRTGKTPLTDGRNGLAVVRILEAASRSLKNGGCTVYLA